jgi:polyphosphate kinase
MQIYRVGTPLDLAALMEIANFEAPALKYQPFQPCTHPRLLDLPEAEDTEDFDDFFDRIRGGEVLLHHPYHSFSSSVAKFVDLAARDPRVLAIKQTLYRTSGDSPIMRSLIEAAKNGKQVLAVIEIRARFDETANVRWAQKLEEAGVHVVYGLLGLKTHAKASLVLREEGDHLRRYSHIGTGNYHPRTARMYEDLGILSADEALGIDLSTLFNQLSGYAPNSRYSRLLVAPKFLRDEIQEKIKRERENHLMGKSSRIRMKLNSIMDQQILSALYEAANAGVPIEINVRGICSFNMLSVENSARIKIRSILGRFLEHSRIYNFHNDGQEEYWIGSADMMDRNLNRRVETLVAATDLEHIRELDKILTSAFSDEYASWSLEADNEWKFNDFDDRGGRRKSYQEFFMKEICP